MRLIGTATDDTTLYMMMDAVMGGELFSYLQVSLCLQASPSSPSLRLLSDPPALLPHPYRPLLLGKTRTRPLDEAHARFYAASVVLAFEYLHDRLVQSRHTR